MTKFTKNVLQLFVTKIVGSAICDRIEEKGVYHAKIVFKQLKLLERLQFELLNGV